MTESVRYAATLDTGEGFVAFAGGYAILPTPFMEVGEVELPADARILPDGFAVWPWHKLRRMAPADDEYVYLVDAFSAPVTPRMVTAFGDGTSLIGTDHPIAGALWGGKVTEYAWDRAAYIEVPV